MSCLHPPRNHELTPHRKSASKPTTNNCCEIMDITPKNPSKCHEQNWCQRRMNWQFFLHPTDPVKIEAVYHSAVLFHSTCKYWGQIPLSRIKFTDLSTINFVLSDWTSVKTHHRLLLSAFSIERTNISSENNQKFLLDFMNLIENWIYY